MTKQEILDTIAPCIKMHQTAGHTIEITKEPSFIEDQPFLKITPSDGAFGSMFISDFSAVCRENFIAFVIGASDNKPYILL